MADEPEPEPEDFDPPLRRGLLRVYRALEGPAGERGFRLTRALLLRSLGLVYLVAFATAVFQLLPLLGSDGLTPIGPHLEGVVEYYYGDRNAAIARHPSLFWFAHGDGVLQAVAILGAVLAAAVLLGLENGAVMLLLWALYLSIVHVGQRWYAFGWETQLLETGFIAVLWCPWSSLRPELGLLWRHGQRPIAAPSPVPLWLYRWLIARIMLGAGLIKLRGDPCWTALTCLDLHFETQPIPGPLSPWFHALPHSLLAGGVLFNHVAELLLPLFVFGPRRLRLSAGVLMILFQVTLILSGNLAFLNWLTIVPAIACLDDEFLSRLVPRRLRDRVPPPPEQPAISRPLRWANLGFAALVLWLSLPVVANLIGRDQAMNQSYGRLHLVNTYGAFGSVSQRRLELIIEGSAAESPGAADRDWRAYEFKCKPGAVERRLCWITPYHLRLDWLAWFAALEVEHRGGLQREDWMLHLVYKLLQGDRQALSLLGNDPFPEAPPRWIRIVVYEYHLAPPSLPWSEAPVWTRERLGELLPPIRGDDERLLQHLRKRGWLTPAAAP